MPGFTMFHDECGDFSAGKGRNSFLRKGIPLNRAYFSVIPFKVNRGRLAICAYFCLIAICYFGL